MNSIITYLIEVIVASGILSGFYFFVLKNLTFFSLNRYYLLIALVTPFVLPLLEIAIPQAMSQNVLSFEVVLGEFVVAARGVEAFDTLIPQELVWMTGYVLIAAVLCLNMIVALVRTKLLFSKAKRYHYDGIDFLVSEDNINPFSFFGRIFVNYNYLNDKAALKLILTHEKTHIDQHHGMDVFVAEFVCMIAWFNPFFWLLKKELKSTHEYLADEMVLEQDVDLAGYFMLIFNTIVGKNVVIANHLNQSLNFKRMKMMKKKRSARFTKMTYVLVLPLIVLVVFLFAEGTSTAKVIQGATNNIITDNGNQALVNDNMTIIPTKKSSKRNDKPVFVVCEQMPSFSGGSDAMMEYLANNIEYPPKAKKKGIEGRVYVEFIVEKDGCVSNVKLLRGANRILDKEAIRVVKAMPNWEPGMQRGEPVRVSYRLPINFALK